MNQQQQNSVAPIVYAGFAPGPSFFMQYIMSFLVLQSSI